MATSPVKGHREMPLAVIPFSASKDILKTQLSITAAFHQHGWYQHMALESTCIKINDYLRNRLYLSSIMPNPAWEQRSFPEGNDIRYIDVARAVEDFERMMCHTDLEPTQKEFLTRGLECCRRWLNDPEKPSTATVKSLKNFLKHTAYLPRICHLEFQPLKCVCKGLRILADACTEEFPHDFSIYEEFGDAFDVLTNLLRCEICFPAEHFNEIDPATGRQYDWSYIASILKNYPFLPLPAWFVRQARIQKTPSPLTETQTSLVVSLKGASNALRLDFNAIAWQIIKYNIYMEIPRGPKQALRTGNWEQLARNILQAHQTLKPLAHLEQEKHKNLRYAACAIGRAVKCAESRWFDALRSSEDYVLSNEALELSWRLAESGDPRSNRDLRSEPLLDLTMYGKTKTTQIGENLLTTVQRDDGDGVREPSNIISLAVARMLGQEPRIPAPVGGEPQLRLRAPINIEPIPGYILEAGRRISCDRALPSYAGRSDQELEAQGIARIPHRGLASTLTFDGFFHVSMGRHTVLPSATEVVEEILRAFKEDDDETICRHGFHINARGYEPLYNSARVLSIAPVLRGIFEYGRPDPNAGPIARLRNDLRLVDLTLTLYTLIETDDLEELLGPATVDFQIVFCHAGEDEETLNRVGLTRHPKLGLIGLYGYFNMPLEAESS
ncbi:predicted protein [Uncinocarpus reesii 1704]|uniref:Uncharacterized protein n=1 Tax=Uncinocarpus reesii (strain UAMH 1704) TaxID=336963 RepID=C4JMA2_UNCRE|nr:uncharacterized protein UREG_03960 [Uncinocarpus reesii 1704]EEP79114.1 predicted protein [Uncinocarpus reesii 1704]